MERFLGRGRAASEKSRQFNRNDWPDSGGARCALCTGQPAVFGIVLRCRLALGQPGLSGACGRQTNCRLPHRSVATGWNRVCHVSQQEARRFSALSCGRFEYPAGDWRNAALPGAACLSESRNSGFVWTVSYREIICGPRPVARISLREIAKSAFPHYKFARIFLSDFACIALCIGVNDSSELIGPRKEAV